MPKETGGFLVWFNLYNSPTWGKWFLFPFYKEETGAHSSNLPKVAWPGTTKAGTGAQILWPEPGAVPHTSTSQAETTDCHWRRIRVGTHCLPDKKDEGKPLPAPIFLHSLPPCLLSFLLSTMKWLNACHMLSPPVVTLLDIKDRDDLVPAGK